MEDERLRKASGNGDKQRADLERQAGAEMRNAAMHGNMPRELFCDLGQLDDATHRERQANRKRRRSRSSSRSRSPSLEKENQPLASIKEAQRGRKRRKKTQVGQLLAYLDEQDAHDRKLLAEEDKKHGELMQGIHELTDCIKEDREAVARDRIGARDVIELLGQFVRPNTQIP